LMLLALETSNTSLLPNIQVTEKYKNYIILGSPFLQHYYVCFEGRSEFSDVSVYEKVQTSLVKEDKILNKICLGLAIGIPVILFAWFCCVGYCKKKDSPKDNLSRQSLLQSHVLHSEEEFIEIRNSMQGMRKSHVVFRSPVKSRTLVSSGIEDFTTRKISEEANDHSNFSFVEGDRGGIRE